MPTATACVAVAFSGGRDSTALLHATLVQARALSLQVVALHVHHGLVAGADAWLADVQRRCARWVRLGYPLQLSHCRLEGSPGPGDSVEAWARRERYAALTRMAREAGATLVLLAHHRRDQAETFVLQALRGGGAAGLAAMPDAIVRDGLTWARPWLGQPREAVEAYVRRHRLGFIDDDSNDDPRFARNRLRMEAWPALAAAFPGAEDSLAAAARRAQEEAECLGELASLDLAHCREGGALSIAAWSLLSCPRRANALRAWLRECMGRGAPETLVERLAVELPGSAAPARWHAPGGELRRYRRLLRWNSDAPAEAPPAPVAGALHVDQPGCYALPAWGGLLHVERADEGGVALECLASLELRPRQGAEQFQRAPRAMPRSLKKQYQAAGVAAWQRNGPLLYCEGQLVFVPGLGVDARARAEKGVPQVTFRWEQDGSNSSGKP